MKKKKLLEIADMLMRYRRSKKISFNMNHWFHKNNCGTVCCAIGMAKLKGILPKNFGKATHNGWVPSMRGDHYTALAEYFRINFARARELFDPDLYSREGMEIAPKRVAKRIRELVKEKTK